VDLQDPVALAAGLVAAAHGRGVARRDVGLDVGAVDLLVRELADQVAGVPAAEHVGAPEVGRELLEDRTEVGEDDVVRLDDPVRRVLPVGEQRVRAGPHDALVPAPGLPEHLVGQVPDPVARRLLALAGRDDAPRPDLVEHCHRPPSGGI